MSGALSAGTVSVAVKPDTKGFGSELKSGILGHTAGVGESMGGMILGGLKMFAGPIAAVTAAFSVKHVLEDSMKAFEDLAGSVKGIQRVTGGTAESVSAMRGAMQLAGVDVNAASGAMTIFAKNLGKAGADAGKTAEMNKLFGQSIKDSTGHVKSMADLLPGLADKFAAMPNGAEKTALATSLFGRAGAQMIPVLNKGSEGIGELTQKAKDMGLVLDDVAIKSFSESRESARNFNASIQGLKVTLGGDLVPVVDAVQNVFRNALSPVIQSVTKFLGEHREAFLKLADTISGFGKTANGALGTFFKSIGDSFKSLGPVFAQLGPQVMQLASAFSPLGLIFKALQPVLPDLIKSVVALAVSIGGSLASVLAEILPSITEVVNILVSGLSGIFKQLMPSITTLAQMLGQTLGDVIKQLAPVVVVLVKAVASLLPPLMPLITQIIQLAISAIMPLAKAILPLITALLPPLVDLLTFLMPIVTALAQVIEAVLVVAIQIAIDILKVIIGVITNVITWFSKFVQGIANAADAVFKWFGNLGETIQGAVSDAANWLVQVGKNIIDGLWNGLKNAWDSVMNWVSNMANSLSDGFKKVLGINSPSRVFTSHGESIGDGLIDGMVAKTPEVEEAARALATAAGSAYSQTASALGASMGAQMTSVISGGGVSNVNGVTMADVTAALNTFAPITDGSKRKTNDAAVYDLLVKAGLIDGSGTRQIWGADYGNQLQQLQDQLTGGFSYTNAAGNRVGSSAITQLTSEYLNSQLVGAGINGQLDPVSQLAVQTFIAQKQAELGAGSVGFNPAASAQIQADIVNAQSLLGIVNLSGQDAMMADGGIVKPVAGGKRVRVAEAGDTEAIIPLHKMGEVVGDYLKASGKHHQGNKSNRDTVIHYHAAPNESIDSERALITAVQRARVMTAWV